MRLLLTITAGVGGCEPACDAIEGLWRNLAARTWTNRRPHDRDPFGGSPDSPDLQAMFASHAAAEGIPLADYLEGVGSSTLPNRLPLVAEVAAAVTLVASDRASAMTGTCIDVTCGSTAS